MAVLRSICTPFSPTDEATTSRKQLDPLPSQLSHKKEKRKKKKKKKRKKNTQRRDSHTGTSVIHQHDQDFRTLDLSAKLHQMTEDNSSWFGNLLGKPWLWIKEIAILLLFLLLAYYLCIHSIKCFFQQMTPASHEEWQFQPEEIITRKNFTDPNCMFLFLCQHAITYKQHRTCTMCL